MRRRPAKNGRSLVCSADSFHRMSIRVVNEGSVIVLTVTRPEARFTLAHCSRRDRCGVELVYRLSSLCCECEMQPPRNGLALTNPKLRFSTTPEPRTGRAIPTLDFHDQSYAERSQGTAVEIAAGGVIAGPKIDVI